MASTVIVGCGLIGLSTAYYLSKHQPGSSIHLVESSPRLFSSTSGLAGGFLAKSWSQSDGVVAALAALSWDEHEKLAQREDGREIWGYSKTVALSYVRGVQEKDQHEQQQEQQHEQHEQRQIPTWLKRVDGDQVDVIDEGQDTAILDPQKLCHFLLDKCKQQGVHLHHPATISCVGSDVINELSYVRVKYTNDDDDDNDDDSLAEEEIATKRLLLCAGAWTPQVFRSLFRKSPLQIPIVPYAGYSVVIRNRAVAHTTNNNANNTANNNSSSSWAVLSSFPDGPSPNFFSRPDGTIYFSGVNSKTTPLPALATGQVLAAAKEQMDLLKRVLRHVVDFGADQEEQQQEEEFVMLRESVCFRPMSGTGKPILTRLDDDLLRGSIGTRPGAEGGVFVAAGHGSWGISQGLGSGLVMAELMSGKETSVDISGLGLGQ